MNEPLQYVGLALMLLLVVVLFVAAGALREMREHLRRAETTADRMEAAAKQVAVNLAKSIARADRTNGGDGAAADAAIRSATDGH